MGKKGVEEMIDEIEAFVEGCKFQPLSSNKIEELLPVHHVAAIGTPALCPTLSAW